MNIAVLTPTYLPIVGGAEVGIYEIYKRIAQRHKVTVYTPRYTQRASYDGAQDDYFDSGGFEVRRYEDRHLFTNWHPRLVKLLDCVYPDYSLGAVCIAQTIISDNRPDVVNCHYLLQNLGAIRYVVQHIGIPVVLSIIGREFDNVGRWCTTRWVASRALERCTKVIYISEFMRKKAGVPRDGDEVVYYGVDAKRYHPGPRNEALLRRHGVPSSAKVVFTVQRLTRVKQLNVLIESFALVAQRISEVVLMIGGVGGDRQRLEQLVAERGIGDKVRWCGFIAESELPEYYRSADVVAFYSANETFGVVVPQAMGSGKPLVTVDCAALSEIVKNGETGLLVKPDDPSQFAEKIVRVLNDQQLGRELSENAVSYALSNFSWDRIAARYEQILGEAILKNKSE